MNTTKSTLLTLAVLLLALVAVLSAAAQPEAAGPASAVYDELSHLPPPVAPLAGSTAAAAPVAPGEPRDTDDVFAWSQFAIQGYGREASWEVSVTDSQIKVHTRLASSPAADIHPKLDRGARRVVFASDRDGDYEIFSINVDGTGLWQLTNNDSDDAWPMWSPDGQRIAFQAYRDGQPEIYVMKADGTGQERLTNNPFTDAMPDWSPDGQQIVFASFRDGRHGIFTMKADGSDQERLVSAVFAQRPKWSPDGTMIAFDADADGDSWQELFVIPVVGGQPTMLANGAAETELMMGGWSPDGKYVVYTDVHFIEYQGEYYWTDSWTEALLLGTGTGIHFYSLNYLWNAQWQTMDAEPPQVGLRPLPPLMAAKGARLEWGSYEVGPAGWRDYLLEVMSATGTWMPYQSPLDRPWAVYDGIPGQTARFRVRARDNAFNVSPITSFAETQTTFYSALLSGRVTDNRGAPLEAARFAVSSGASDASSDSDGRVTLPMTAAGFQGVDIYHISFPDLLSPNRRVTPGMVYEPYLPGEANRLNNGELNGSLAGWTAAGSQPPAASNDAFRGAGSVHLGAPCLGACLAEAVSLTREARVVTNMAADGLGNIHVLWQVIENHRATYYHSLRAPDGTWTSLVAIDGGQPVSYEPLMAADAAGGLHVLWKRGVAGDTRLHYAYRSPHGVWQAPTALPGTAALDGLLALDADSHGNVYALADKQYETGIFFFFKPAGASWAPAEDLTARMHMTEAGGLAVGPDDRVYLLATLQLGTLLETEWQNFVLTRTAGGQWGMEPGGPPSDYIQSFDIGPDGSLYALHGNPYGTTATLYWREPSGTWRQTTLPVAEAHQRGAIDSLGRYYAIGGDGSYSVWTPNAGWQTPMPLNIAWGLVAVDAYDLPHVIGLAPYPAPDEVFYFGPAAATLADSSILWQQVAIPAAMPSPTLAFMQRRHGELPDGQTELTAFVDEGGVITPLPVAAGGRAWSLAWADLSPWQGKTVKVGLRLDQAVGEPSAQAWLDDITLTPGYADLLVQTESARSVLPGEATPVRITLRNQGGVAAAGIEMNARLDDALTFISASPPPTTIDGQVLKWSLGSLPAFSEEQVITLTVRGVPQGANLDWPRYIDVGAGTTTPERHFANNGRIHELIIAAQSFMPTVR